MIHNSWIIQKCLQMEYQIKNHVETGKSKKTVGIKGGIVSDGLCQKGWFCCMKPMRGEDHLSHVIG